MVLNIEKSNEMGSFVYIRGRKYVISMTQEGYPALSRYSDDEPAEYDIKMATYRLSCAFPNEVEDTIPNAIKMAVNCGFSGKRLRAAAECLIDTCQTFDIKKFLCFDRVVHLYIKPEVLNFCKVKETKFKASDFGVCNIDGIKFFYEKSMV